MSLISWTIHNYVKFCLLLFSFQKQDANMFMIFIYLFADGLLNWLQNVVAFSLLHLGGVSYSTFRMKFLYLFYNGMD